jgi:uncharacterized RDD family membrane protein YckC
MEPVAVSDRASFGTRLLAAIIDGVLVGIASGILRFLGIRLLPLLIGVAYYVFLEGGPSGQTLGKRAMDIRVVDIANGGPIGFGRAAIRYFGRFVSGIVLGLGYLWMLWDPEKQTWHDKFAQCTVVSTANYPVDKWPG